MADDVAQLLTCHGVALMCVMTWRWRGRWCVWYCRSSSTWDVTVADTVAETSGGARGRVQRGVRLPLTAKRSARPPLSPGMFKNRNEHRLRRHHLGEQLSVFLQNCFPDTFSCLNKALIPLVVVLWPRIDRNKREKQFYFTRIELHRKITKTLTLTYTALSGAFSTLSGVSLTLWWLSTLSGGYFKHEWEGFSI